MAISFGDIYISESPDLKYWGRHRRVMTRGGTGWWQGTKIGAGPAPTRRMPDGLFYHGVATCSGYVYSMGAAILDIPSCEGALLDCRFILTPEEQYETTGFVPNVIFPAQQFTMRKQAGSQYITDGGYMRRPVFAQVDELSNILRIIRASAFYQQDQA